MPSLVKTITRATGDYRSAVGNLGRNGTIGENTDVKTKHSHQIEPTRKATHLLLIGVVAKSRNIYGFWFRINKRNTESARSMSVVVGLTDYFIIPTNFDVFECGIQRSW